MVDSVKVQEMKNRKAGQASCLASSICTVFKKNIPTWFRIWMCEFNEGIRWVTDHGTRICILLSKLQRQVGHGLSDTFHRHRLVVSEPVVLRRKRQRVSFRLQHGVSKTAEMNSVCVFSFHTCVSTRALSIKVLASAIKPLMAQPERWRRRRRDNMRKPDEPQV